MLGTVGGDTTDLLERLANGALAREEPARNDALALLATGDEVLLDVVAAAARVRRHFFSNRVKLNFLVNMKSGLCPEDCSYCSQAKGSDAEILRYNWIDPETAEAAATRAVAAGASRICLVASGRGPSARDVARVATMARRIHEHTPGIEICVSLGLLGEDQGENLKEAGVFAYNHNLNTSAEHYGQICHTHTYDDRRHTVASAAAAGLSPCSGAIFGMGERDEDIVAVAHDLRALSPDSVPVNFLLPFEGTPLEGRNDLTPGRCLRILSLFRFFFPDVEVRTAAGREAHLRSLQPLALHVANSIFLGDYLTSEGRPGAEDLAMVAEGGFVLESDPRAGTGSASGSERPPVAVTVASRRRGPGTALPVNA